MIRKVGWICYDGEPVTRLTLENSITVVVPRSIKPTLTSDVIPIGANTLGEGGIE